VTRLSAIGELRELDLRVDYLTIGEDVRLDEDVSALAELALSVSKFGILQPLVVRPAQYSVGGWEVVSGRRRLAAARLVGLDVVPCVVRQFDDEGAFDAALAENLHRRDLSWIEVALAYARLRDRGMQQREIAELVGKSETHVSQVLKLLTIPKELQGRVHRRELSYATALDLATRGSTKGSPGGRSTKGSLGAADAELATHWRRRHDRLVAGIRAVLAANAGSKWRELLEQLLKIDVRSLDGRTPDQEQA
jgi:ParB/RepB/Spo0J family partition protein